MSRVKSPAAADMNRETDVEMNNTGAAKMANNSGNADGTAPTPVELQSYDAVDSVMRGIPHSKPTQFAHISSSSFLITSLLTPPPPSYPSFTPINPLFGRPIQLELFHLFHVSCYHLADESMSKLKNKKGANNTSAVCPNSTKKRPDELVLDIDCRKNPKDDDTIR